MADTSAQKSAELWIVREFLPKEFDGMTFAEQKVRLTWGGHFAFDAVSSDQEIVGLVSTSSASTSGGKRAIAKIQKLKCDTLYLTNVAKVCKKFLVFSEQSMKTHFEKEISAGRFPTDITLIHADLPIEIYQRVLVAREMSRREVTPFLLDK
jgi:hypothetical protein